MDGEAGEGLPLREAVLRWSDPALVAACAAAEARRGGVPAAGREPNYFAGASAREREAWRERRSQESKADLALERARQALVEDFRRRVEHGQVHLRGVQTLPQRRVAAEPVPGVWAADFRFDVTAGTIDFPGHRYVAVTASLAPPEGEGRGAANAQPAGAAATRPASVAYFGQADPAPGRRRGRESYDPLIEEALRARWDHLATRVSADPDGKLNHTTAAKALLIWLRTKYPERHRDKHLPSSETIRTRLPKIYRRLLSEKAVR